MLQIMDALGIHIPLLIILNNFISCLTSVFLEAYRKPPGQAAGRNLMLQ